MAAPLWRIPNPAEAMRQAEARRQVELEKREADRKEKEIKAAGRRRERFLIQQRLTDQRLREEREWRAKHKPPTQEQLDALAREYPHLAGVLGKGKR